MAYKRYAIGIILSGTGSDGALGMTKISQNGGLTIVQEPSEAKFSGMPNKSIATGEIHCISSSSDMSDIILDYTSQPHEFDKNLKQTKTIVKSEYNELFELLNKKYKINFNSYKHGTISRRIQRRMQQANIDNLKLFTDSLANDDKKLKALYDDLLIGVTQFFRDPEAFTALKLEVLPVLFAAAKKTNESIRIWVTPCATGEEAYSIAILFKEYSEEQHLPFSVNIFASDISNDYIKKAKKGRYSYKSLSHLPAHLLTKYFTKKSHYYEIIPEIREHIIFTTNNLLTDLPFTKIDLMCCRNLLIYINPIEQKRITDFLRFGLNIGGFLFLGPSENISPLEPELTIENQAWKFFKKKQKSHLPDIATLHQIKRITKDRLISQSKKTSVPIYAYHSILHDLVSAGFIIDQTYEILHTIGLARTLLTLPEGAPSLKLPEIIINDLKGTLIMALHKAKNKLINVVYDNINVQKNDEQTHTVQMTVHPISNKNNEVSYYWIRMESNQTTIKKQKTLVASNVDEEDDAVIIALEGELTEVRSMLQNSVESMESVNQEIQASNEELMASNEEMQSTNEELQSVNEELFTVNTERTKKIEEINQAKTDIDNLIRSAEICTIILNTNLEIRIFTPDIKKIFNLVNHDIGRSLKNFRHNLKFDHLIPQIEYVIQKNTSFECEVKNNLNYWYFLKITPYYTQEGSVNGVVVTLTDINETKVLQQNKEETEKNLRLVLKSGLIGIWQYDLANQLFTYDGTIKNILGLHSLTSINQLSQFIATIHLNDRKRLEQSFALASSTNDGFEQNFRIIRPDKSIRYLSCSAKKYRNTLSDSDNITGVCWDMTEQYWLEEKIINAEHLNLGLDAITDGWWDWNLQNNQLYLSPLLKKTLGYDDHELSNRPESYEHLIAPEELKLIRNYVKKYISTNSHKPFIQKIKMKHKDGHSVWILSRGKGIINNKGRIIRIVGTHTNITDLEKNEKTLKQLAYRDSLTNVSNRPSFLDALFRAIARAQRNQSLLAVMFVDIDNFKKINDNKGHAIGDAVLCEVTKRLINTSRAIDLLARIGGDEFSILLEDITSFAEIRDIAARYISAFSEPLSVEGTELFISISIGVALYPEHGLTSKELMSHADAKMYLAKKRGKNQYAL